MIETILIISGLVLSMVLSFFNGVLFERIQTRRRTFKAIDSLSDKLSRDMRKLDPNLVPGMPMDPKPEHLFKLLEVKGQVDMLGEVVSALFPGSVLKGKPKVDISITKVDLTKLQ